MPVQFSQSFNYNMDRTNAEKELLIPRHGWNFMKIALTPSVVGNYPVRPAPSLQRRAKSWCGTC